MKNTHLKILDFLKSERNFDYSGYHFAMLERRIQNRIIHLGSITPEAYFEYLQNNPEESTRLIENFMINVSHFFRDPLSFELLAKVAIPAIIASKQRSDEHSIRIWSAGCARGEEAYSVAMLFNEYFAREMEQLNLDFFATDFDSQAIEKAKQGIYTSTSMKEVKHGLLKKYFTEGDETYTIIPELKMKIQFSIYDLLYKNSYAPSESIFGDFDLVLCRNVLIYFNQEFQKLILNKLIKSLAPKGVLMLGESEVLGDSFKEKLRQISKYAKIFEKK
ncbi:MAG: hypothetical protein A2W85_06760 [Bacteroidetes bacterium GWF2_41_31]|nr:MAG: hypothetical protein A2W85_06760 [Bacteroidetes bacterium GWF2_41_31]